MTLRKTTYKKKTKKVARLDFEPRYIVEKNFKFMTQHLRVPEMINS